MPTASKGGRYHHGDLRAALIGTTIEIIAERGGHGFSMAEATRRLGVAASAPYAHFADRDALLAAVAVHAYQLFSAELMPQADTAHTPVDRLAAMARGYVRFAAAHRPLFDLLYDSSLDKARHPELEEAERPINEGFSACVLAIAGDDQVADDLATAVEATAHGLVTLLLDGEYHAEAVEQVADRAARATLALVESRHLLGPPPGGTKV
jgi:AcrR family transcriptional regulator